MSDRADVIPGTLETMVLHVIGAGSMHGYAIAREIESRSGQRLRIEEGSLYPRLRRMEADGLLLGSWHESETGRRARHYTLTPAGYDRLERASEQWRVNVEAVLGVLGKRARLSKP